MVLDAEVGGDLVTKTKDWNAVRKRATCQGIYMAMETEKDKEMDSLLEHPEDQGLLAP